MADKYVKQFISLINEIILHDRYTVFNDWCAMTAISIQNAVWFRDFTTKAEPDVKQENGQLELF